MPRHTRLPSVCLLALVSLAACGNGDGVSSDTAGVIEVVSTDDACIPARTSFPAGKVRLAVKNSGSAATELYVYEDGKVLTEVENVGPGTSRSLSAVLMSGKAYELACKPGGREIRVPIAVTG